MADSQITPGSTFQYLLNSSSSAAMAWVRGGRAFPAISGLVKFYRTPWQGILVEREFFNLPGVNIPGSSSFFAMHIHQDGDCSAGFTHTGGHLGAPQTLHPFHAGDFPPLLSGQGYAWDAFYDKRFTIEEILGRSVALHRNADDFRSQPAGNSGGIIACGVIRTA